MVVEYIADTSKLVSSVANVKQAANEGAASLREMATRGAEVAAVALIGVGVASTKMAGDFQQGVIRLKTGAGDITDNMTQMGKSILATSVATGVLTNGTDGLNAAMYLIISSGQRGAEALDTLSVAAKGAQIEQAGVVEVANTLSGVMTNYGTTNFTATQYMNGLIGAVKQGKITLQDLATAMGPVDPIAQQLGISFNDMAAAMTTQTNAMIPADRAATGLRFMMLALENPTGKAKDAMKALGLDSVKVAEEMKVSLPGALNMIYDAAKKAGPEGSVPFSRAVADMVGGIRSLSTFSALTGEHMKDFTKNSAGVLTAMQQNKNAVVGWDEVQGNFNIKMDQAKATLASLGISIGTALLPVLSKALDAFSSPAFQQFATTVAGALTSALLGLINGVSTLVQWGTQLVSFFQHNQAAMATLQVVAATLAGAILGALVVAFAMGAAAAASTAIAFLSVAWPVILIVAAIAGLGVGLFLLYQRFAPVREVVNSVGQTFVMLWGVIMQALMPAWVELRGALNNAMPMFQFIGAVILGIVVVAIGILIAAVEGLAVGIGYAITGIIMIVTGFVDMWNGGFQIMAGIVFFFKDLVTGNFSQLGADLGLIWRGIINLFVGGWDMIKGVFVTVGGFLVGFVGGFVVGIIQFFQHLFDALVGHSIIPDMVNGIINWFLQLPGRAGAAIQSMITNVLSLLNGLVSSALQVGSNIVNNIAQGIRNAIGAVGNAITAVTNFISAHLPHSPAKMGPLMDLEYQGAQISNQIAKGMLNGTPLITSAMNNLAKPVTVGLKGVASTNGVSPSQGGQGDTYITITMDGTDITNRVMKRVKKEIQPRSKK
jgi:TP901 family phage tail tape measure protein